MSESNDINNGDKHLHPDDATTVEKVWVIDWNNRFQRTSSEEKTNYMDALKIFNEKTKEGKNAILYEVQKSISNGKMLKRIPILNSSKYADRKKNLPHDQKEPAIKKTGGVFSSRKSRFIILLVIIVAFIITLYVLNIMASGGTMSGHHMILGTMESNSVGVTSDGDFAFL